MGTIADKLAYLGQTKSEIRDAIISKGVPVAVETSFREYAGKIREITDKGGTENPEEWKRPTDWLRIDDSVREGDQKFVGLYAVFEEGNFISFSATGDYTVDWGDGKIENFASGVPAYHIYSYHDFKGTETSEGHRQAIVTIIPQNEQDLTGIHLQRRHNQDGLNTAYSSGWLDIRMSGPNIRSLVVGGTLVFHRYLESFCFLGSNEIFSFNRLFYGCSQLQSVPVFDTSRGVRFNGMFQNCMSLKTVPLLNTSNGDDFGYMFDGCSGLQTIPLLDTSNGIIFFYMFNGCLALKSVPLLNTSNGINFSYMFKSCTVLRSIPLLDTANATHFMELFYSCTTLENVPLLNTANGIDFRGMLTHCNTLAKASFLGTKETISYENSKLSKKALVDIFKNLAADVVSKTITITNNWGVNALTKEERAIATDKGWTIVG